MKKVVIIGATSGIGMEIARLYLKRGYRVGLAGRRVELLQPLKESYFAQVEIEPLDVTAETADEHLLALIHRLGGMDLLVLSSGVGSQNRALQLPIEMMTAQTNVCGFIRIVNCAYHYFKQQGRGHLAAISSIAGTKGIGVAPAYSATKRFQNSYLEALMQLSSIERVALTITDIRPGFVDTPLLKQGSYPMLMQPDRVADLIVQGIDRRKRVLTIDWRYRLLVTFWKLIPSSIWVRWRVGAK